jgi:hypothetical protein
MNIALKDRDFGSYCLQLDLLPTIMLLDVALLPIFKLASLSFSLFL